MVRVTFRFQCLVLLSALALSFAQPAVQPVAAQTRAAPPASALIDLNSASRDALMVSTEPERLGIELVNRYHALKRAGTI